MSVTPRFLFEDAPATQRMHSEGACVAVRYTGTWGGGGTMKLASPSCLRVLLHRSFRLEPVAPGTQRASQFLRDRHTPSGSQAFRPLCVSLYVPLEVKEVWKSTGQLVLDINLVCPA